MNIIVAATDEIVLNEKDTIASVKQNVAVLLATRRGTVPLDRNFGMAEDILDRPITAAKALYIADLTEAIEKYEPRAKVVAVTFQSDGGRLYPTVEVEINAK